MVRHVPDPAPIGADAVLAPRGWKAASRLRLALLRLRARGRLRAGRDVRVARGASVRVAPGGSVTLGSGCLLGPGSRIEAAGGAVAVGPGARLGDRCVIVALAAVTVGGGAVVGDWAVISDAEPAAADVETPIRHQPLSPRPVEVGERARIGAHAAIGAGARIAAGAVVGSYAVVPTPVATATSP
jgi:acetyltransferase-like isoleucine patch superfamily enzyme